MSKKPSYDEVVAAYDRLVTEKERYRTALQRIVDIRGKHSRGTSNLNVGSIARKALRNED